MASQPPTYPDEILCSESEVCDLLAALDPCILVRLVDRTVYPLECSRILHTALLLQSKLFNLSLTTGAIPSPWKKSLVVPIPNSQELSNPSNYCPVSFLPILSKVLERHIFMIVMDHLQHNHSLFAFQWGFLEGRSTVTTLLHLTDQWFQALEVGHDVCVVFFRLSKSI